ncbi:MAG: SPOR domain-containing protein [Bacteriovoracia bacterium]
MEKKHRFLVYDPREMVVLVTLAVMITVLGFTLGVHLGKQIPSGQAHKGEGDFSSVETVRDQTPSQLDLSEQGKGADSAADNVLNSAVQGEVARTGLKLDTPRQVELPDKTVSQQGGATQPPQAHVAGKPAEKTHGATVVKGADSLPALARPAPSGKFTIQVGSFPSLDDARPNAEVLETRGLKPFIRSAEVSGKKWYRVYLGGYPTKKAAEEAGTKWVHAHAFESFIVSKMP